MTRPAPAPDGADAIPANHLVSAARPRVLVALRDIDIAPENLRYSEPADDDVPLLAETLIAAGQLQPLTVRPGRRKERANMALDGRRRILALRSLAEAGRIDDGFLVDVFVETDPARQAAAVLLTNTAVPVHVADVILAIGRMLKGKLGVPGIAKALGYAELDVKRLAALSALPVAALDALRAGRLTLRQAKLLARLPDPAEQAELAQLALEGHGFQDWRITEKLDAQQVSAKDPRCHLVSLSDYTAAGGRIDVDLFGERPPVLLDPAVLTDLWTRRMRDIALVFEAEGLTTHVSAGEAPSLSDDLERAGYVYGGMLPAAEMAAYRDLRQQYQVAMDDVESAIVGSAEAPEVNDALIRMIRARLAMDQAGWGGRVATTLVLQPSAHAGLDILCFTPVEPEPDIDGDSEAKPDDETPSAPAFIAPEFDAPMPELEGVSHALHAVRTDVATRGLIRALADAPAVALTAMIARLFMSAAVARHGPSDAALAVSATAYDGAADRVIDALDGEVRQRLDARRSQWEASGLTLIRWIHDLPDAERAAFLAELVAVTLNLREDRTTSHRRTARIEAAELAMLCDADITRYWTPSGGFLRAHSKSQLVGMLDVMGRADTRAALMKKTDLIPVVETAAAETRWAPPCLSWFERPPGGEPMSATDAVSADAGQGAFEVTPQGLDALGAAA